MAEASTGRTRSELTTEPVRWYTPLAFLTRIALEHRASSRLPIWLRSRLGRWAMSLAARRRLDALKAGTASGTQWALAPESAERIDLPGFWMVEFFAASHAGDLRARLSTRRWRRQRMRPEDSPAARVAAARESLGATHERLATFVPLDNAMIWPFEIPSRLPSEFKAIEVFHIALGSSLTAIVAAVHLTHDASRVLDRVIRFEHPARLERVNGVLKVIEGPQVGHEALQTAREELHAMGRAWLTKELPGTFALEAPGNQPVFDLLVTHEYDPLDASSDERERFLVALGLTMSEYSIEYLAEEKVRLIDRGRLNTSGDDHVYSWSLVANARAAGENIPIEEEEDIAASEIFSTLSSKVSDLASRLAILSLLDLKSRMTAITRDAVSQTYGIRPVRGAKRLRASLLSTSLDVMTTARDIRILASERVFFEWMVPVIHRKPGRWGDRRAPLKKKVLKGIAELILRQLDEVVAQEAELTRLLDVVTNVTSSIESIRSQRWAIVLAVLSLVAAIAAIWLAATVKT